MKWEQYIASLSWLNVRITKEKCLEWVGSERLSKRPQLLEQEIQALRNFRKKNKDVDWGIWVESQLKWMDDHNISTSLIFEKGYPQEFMGLEYPPLFLSYKGKPAWLERPSLSVVGSREPSPLSVNWLDQNLPEVINSRDINIVSGGARGIDQRAHSICIRNQKPTICFLPSGLQQIYPKSLNSWVNPIIESNGCVMSTFAPFARMQKSYFHYRNQWIAQMSDLVFVVEANRKSGSYLTAQKALKLGKDIVTLPCSPMEKKSQGNLDLLFDGALMVRDCKDLLGLI